MSVIEEERTMEASPTEKRIDDLSGRIGRFEGDVRERFDQVDRRFERFEDNVDRRFDKIDARFDKLDERFDKWGRMIAGGVVAVAVSIIAKVLGL